MCSVPTGFSNPLTSPNIYIYISFLLMFFVVRHKPTDRRPKKNNANLPLPWVPFQDNVQCSDAEKCMRLSKLQRGVTSPSKDHCTDKLGSKYGGTNGAVAVVVSRCRCQRGVSSAVSPLQEAQLALRRVKTPWWFREIRYTKLKETGRPWNNPMDLHRWVFGVVDEYILWNLVVKFGIFEVSTAMYGIFTYSCFIFYGTCMQMYVNIYTIWGMEANKPYMKNIHENQIYRMYLAYMTYRISKENNS